MWPENSHLIQGGATVVDGMDPYSECTIKVHSCGEEPTAPGSIVLPHRLLGQKIGVIVRSSWPY